MSGFGSLVCPPDSLREPAVVLLRWLAMRSWFVLAVWSLGCSRSPAPDHVTDAATGSNGCSGEPPAILEMTEPTGSNTSESTSCVAGGLAGMSLAGMWALDGLTSSPPDNSPQATTGSVVISDDGTGWCSFAITVSVDAFDATTTAPVYADETAARSSIPQEFDGALSWTLCTVTDGSLVFNWADVQGCDYSLVATLTRSSAAQ